jgi:hypothetical protein
VEIDRGGRYSLPFPHFAGPSGAWGLPWRAWFVGPHAAQHHAELERTSKSAQQRREFQNSRGFRALVYQSTGSSAGVSNTAFGFYALMARQPTTTCSVAQ